MILLGCVHPGSCEDSLKGAHVRANGQSEAEMITSLCNCQRSLLSRRCEVLIYVVLHSWTWLKAVFKWCGFITYVYVRMLNTRQWTSLRVLSTPYVYVRKKKRRHCLLVPLSGDTADRVYRSQRWKSQDVTGAVGSCLECVCVGGVCVNFM